MKHWILKKYNDNGGAAGSRWTWCSRRPPAQFGLPLSLFTYEPALTSQVNQALYQVTVGGRQPSATAWYSLPTTLTFHYAQTAWTW